MMKLEQKITLPNINTDFGIGYIHKLSLTEFVDEQYWPTQYIYVRLDTAELVPGYTEESTAEEIQATIQFIFEHLIGVVKCEEQDVAEETGIIYTSSCTGFGIIAYDVNDRIGFLAQNGYSFYWNPGTTLADITNEGE